MTICKVAVVKIKNDEENTTSVGLRYLPCGPSDLGPPPYHAAQNFGRCVTRQIVTTRTFRASLAFTVRLSSMIPFGMASRIASKRVCPALRAPRVNYTSARLASAASAVKGSSLPQEMLDSIAVST